MSESRRPYTLAEDEKATPVMIYTMASMAWGEVVTKELVRVNTFLRTLAPDYVALYDARLLPLGVDRPDQAIPFTELHIRTPQIIAFHLLPPAEEPADYDPTEANRVMELITTMVGPFRIDASIRTSTMTSLGKHLDISTEAYMSLYDAAVSCPTMPALGTIRTPMVLIRRDLSSFAPRQ